MLTRRIALVLCLVSLRTSGENTAPKSDDIALRASKASDVEKAQQSSEALTRMRFALKDGLGKLEEARATKDVVKLNCVNEKLTQIKGLLKISEQSDVSLQEAMVKQEKSSAEHEFTKILIRAREGRSPPGGSGGVHWPIGISYG